MFVTTLWNQYHLQFELRSVDIITFQIHNSLFSLELSRVKQVLFLGPITPVPWASSMVAGAINIRGEVIIVLKLESLLMDECFSTASQGDPGLLVKKNSDKFVIHVDQVMGVKRLVKGHLISSGSMSGFADVVNFYDLEAFHHLNLDSIVAHLIGLFAQKTEQFELSSLYSHLA